MSYLLVLGYEGNLLYSDGGETLNSWLNKTSYQLNTFAKGIPPYGRFLKEGMEFVTLAFHIFFLTFTWHFIVAVKRCTKR
jgi:large-conductance mechanosensitive channel